MTISADADTAQSRHVPLSRLRELPSSTVETQQKAVTALDLSPGAIGARTCTGGVENFLQLLEPAVSMGNVKLPPSAPMGFLTTCVLTDYIRLHRTNQSSAPANRVRNIAKATVDTKVRTACRRPQRV